MTTDVKEKKQATPMSYMDKVSLAMKLSQMRSNRILKKNKKTKL